MSNVVKLAAKKKKPGSDEWQAQIDQHGDNLMNRVYDAIRLTEAEASDDGIPEEYVDCMLLGILACALVQVAYTREVMPPDRLITFLKHLIETRMEQKE